MLLQSCRSITKVSSHSLLATGAGRLCRTTSLSRSSFQVMQMSSKVEGNKVIYTGPLTTVAKRLKLFSISSLGLSGAISPFVFILDFPVPVVAKTVLVASALFTSVSSTALINWVMSPYVTKATITPSDTDSINLHTLNVFAQEHVTTVPIKDLQPSTRVFTTIMINEGKIGEATGKVNGKIVKPKQVFYVHPEICHDGPLSDALVGSAAEHHQTPMSQ